MVSMAATPITSSTPPEQGQLARLRNRLFIVQDVIPAENGQDERATRVDLECLDDDRLGETLSVIWEREVNTDVLFADALPIPEGRWDTPQVFDAFLTAIRWSSASALDESGLLAPFHGAIEIEPYQLEPVARAVQAPRVNLLIADDVGLGKTIEAGLVLQELLARARIRNCLIVCPASLQRQWQEEMSDKFNLRFDIIDRERILKLRREYGTHVNPWRSFPRLITSTDFLKAERHLNSFLAPDEHGNPPQWDLLILDEAHNCAPSGRTRYVRDSQRTRMLRRIAPHFQHRLFLTATPHNGFTESFTALLELLDPLRFHSDDHVDSGAVATVMVRRIKEELRGTDTTTRNFPKRTVQAIPVPSDSGEDHAATLLDAYIESRVARAADRRELFPVRFALNILKKRFLSSPLAFANSLDTHLEHVTRPGAAPMETTAPDLSLTERLIRKLRDDTASDEERDRTETQAVAESTRFFGELTPDEETALDALWQWAGEHREQPDAKLRALRAWVDAHLRTAGGWNDERLILFTEYRDTHDYLRAHLVRWLGPDRVLSITGDTPLSEREEVKAAFQAPPSEHPVRVLVATDAAGEGLNFQNHCRYLIHYEIPWNPNRMEQRNGRIDRHGQTRDVEIFHFLHESRRDSQFLQTIVDKVERMRHDLGAVAGVLEQRVEEYMLGRHAVDLDAVRPRRALADDIGRERLDLARIRKLREQLDDTRRRLDLEPDTLRHVLDAALKLEGHPGLQPAGGVLEDDGAVLRTPPAAWGDAAARSLKDARGRLLTLVFDPEIARGRRHVTLVHLDHPLMRRALATFRRHMFSLGVDAADRLARTSYLVLPDRDLPRPILLVPLRLLGTGPAGRKLHEAVETLAWEIGPSGLVPLERFEPSWPEEAQRHPAIPAALGSHLTGLLRRAEHTEILPRLHRLADARRTEVERRLEERIARETAEVRDLASTRVKEIRSRLKQLSRYDTEQRALYDELDRGQIRDDIRRLKRRLDDILAQREEAPAKIKARYRLRNLRAFPLGVRFLLPESVVRQGRLP